MVFRNSLYSNQTHSKSQLSWLPLVVVGMMACFGFLSELSGQEATIEDYKKLRINEIIADNDLVEPQNWRCRNVDMVEIYNGSDKDLNLDGPLGTVRMSDGSLVNDAQPNSPFRYFTFRSQNARILPAGERLIIFCDESTNPDDRDEACHLERNEMDFNELHAGFRLDSNGETLWIEIQLRSDLDNPVKIHEVQYPSLPEDVAFARFPEDVDNLDTFVFTTAPTFGTCQIPDVDTQSACVGSANEGATAIRPDIELIDYQSNAPGPDEAAQFRIRLRDEKDPSEDNFKEVGIRYRVDGGEEMSVTMSFLGMYTDEGNDLEKWSIWEGDIPAQAAGSLVEFHFTATDADDLVDTTPGRICDYGTGPCDRNDPDGPGPGCSDGQECNTRLQYVVGRDTSLGLVINEVVPNNHSIIEDPSEIGRSCSFPNLNCRYDDFIELVNTTKEEIDLTGLVLARGPFRPERGWVFREGSKIEGGEHLIIWTDNDDKEPDPGDENDPPNPNNPLLGAHHTTFQLDASRDEIFLFKPVSSEAGTRFQLIDAARWGTSGRYYTVSGPIVDPVAEAVVPLLERPESLGIYGRVGQDQSLARVPNAQPTSPWILTDKDDVTPGESNGGDILPEFLFRRGDANQDTVLDIADAVANLSFQFLGAEGFSPKCMDALDVDDNGGIDVTDPIFALSYQFLGTAAPPAPGPTECGADPTVDTLVDEECVYDASCEGEE